MIYAYQCEKCGGSEDIIKPVAEYRRPEFCGKCGVEMRKAVVPVKLHIYNTKVQDKKFQPALGRAATDAELKQEAKLRGWEEVGGESLDHIQPPKIEYPTFTDEDIKSLTPEKLASL